MSKVKLYIAQTEDGFIADKNGSVAFLNELTMPKKAAEKYEEFLSSVDVIIMGGTTYRQIVNELSPGVWPYAGTKTFVITEVEEEYNSEEDITFLSGDIGEILEATKIESVSNIWLLGGANIAKQFHNKGLIDEYLITTVPVKIGIGVELFTKSISLPALKKVYHDEYDGFKEDIYIL